MKKLLSLLLLIGVVGCTSTSIDERYKDEKTREIEEKRYQDYVAKAKIKAIEGQKRRDALLKTTNKETLPKKTNKETLPKKTIKQIASAKPSSPSDNYSLELSCKLDASSIEDSKPIRVQLRFTNNGMGGYEGEFLYPKKDTPPFYKGYVNGDEIVFSIDYIQFEEKLITGVVDMNFLTLKDIEIDRFSGNIVVEDGAWTRKGNCWSSEEKKF